MLLVAGIIGVVVALALLPTQAVKADSAYIYWTTNNGSTVGRADLDGSNANAALFAAGGTSWGIAVNSQYVYWSVDRSVASGVKIGRAGLDGQSPDPDFLTTTTPPYGIAIDSNYIYWSNKNRGTIGRANLDGTGTNLDFITGITEPIDVTVDSGHVYWTSLGPGYVGRANLDGTGKTLNWITGAHNPQGVAVSATNVYWTNGLNNIGRANIDGTGANQSFIAAFNSPAGIAVTDSHIYWAAVTGHAIMSANLDGSGAAVLINTVDQPWSVAIRTIRSSSSSGLASDTLPASVPQSIGIPASGNCDAVVAPSLNWAGTTGGGWTKSWAQWPNSGTGGYVCNRVLSYSSSSGTWQAGALS